MNILKATARLVSQTFTSARGFGSVTLLSAVVLAPLVESATETPPNRMTVQSYITDDTGTPLGSTTAVNKKMVFVLYNADTGGEVVFADEQIVTVDAGHFSVVLGEGSPVGEESHDLATAFSGADASDRFIEIQVSDTDGSNAQTLSPRLRLLPSAYAFLAAYANEAAKVTGGGVGSSAIAASAVNSSHIADNSIGYWDIGENAVGQSELENNAVTSVHVVDNSLTSADLGVGSVGSSEVADNSLTASDLAANSVGASEIAANAVGNSELVSDLTFSGAIGINRRYHNVALTTKALAGDDYITYNMNADDQLVSYQNLDGYSRIYRRVSTNPSYLSILSLIAVTPNSGTDNWELAIDVNDAGGIDEDLFFYLNGSQKGWLDADGSGFKASSDIRLKQDISDVGGFLEKAIQLKPKSYRFKSNPTGELQIGFIAQDVQAVLPELVDSDEEYMGLSYGRFGVVAIGAVTELNDKVEALEAQNAALNERLAALEALVESLAQ